MIDTQPGVTLDDVAGMEDVKQVCSADFDSCYCHPDANAAVTCDV